ncbi:hypothetical protein SAMN05216333_101131 [Nitrosomonas oligotropha]|uniref:Uncharacterized protein n=1 Tax=Nitrosomonas oligotropha TaxID=42354 RepID=A0A1H8J895_9PROT|nr:hypothetical protein SAMN05216300_101169 [Nitrosomonas oligotropha]SEN77004.1 hypothetical protein SAMN05216333_101131 [Nitrosomonas oligotropha]
MLFILVCTRATLSIKTSHSDFANTYRKFNNTVNFELNQFQKAVTQGSLI